MILDSGIPHCWVPVKVETARGSIVGSAYISMAQSRDTKPTSSLAKITYS